MKLTKHVLTIIVVRTCNLNKKVNYYKHWISYLTGTCITTYSLTDHVVVFTWAVFNTGLQTVCNTLRCLLFVLLGNDVRSRIVFGAHGENNL